jgi:hypothetical protein
MNQWNASVVVIGGASTRWPEAVPLLAKGKQPEAVEIVNAAAAVAEIVKINGHARVDQYREVRNKVEKLLQTCRQAAEFVENSDVKNAAVARIGGGLFRRLEECLSSITEADRVIDAAGKSKSPEPEIFGLDERLENTNYPRDVAVDALSAVIKEG